MKYLFFYFILTSSAYSNCSEDEIANGVPLENSGYGEVVSKNKIRGLQSYSKIFDFPTDTKKETFVRHIQAFIDDQYLSSFAFVGNYYDFFHGHLLTLENEKDPSFILYHTQEEASNNLDPSCKYSHINRMRRNYLQILNAENIISNAISYIDPVRWDNAEFTEQFRKFFTARSHDLLINGYKVARDQQFSFWKVKCEHIPVIFRNELTNFFSLEVSGQVSCYLFAGIDPCGRHHGANLNKCIQRWLSTFK